MPTTMHFPKIGGLGVGEVIGTTMEKSADWGTMFGIPPEMIKLGENRIKRIIERWAKMIKKRIPCVVVKTIQAREQNFADKLRIR